MIPKKSDKKILGQMYDKLVDEPTQRLPHYDTNILDELEDETSYSAKASQTYDPYDDYLSKHGISKTAKIRQKTSYLHIDSTNRTATTRLKILQMLQLQSNPAYFVGTNLRFAVQSTASFNINDKILVSGIAGTQLILRNIVENEQSIIFTQNHEHVKLLAPSNMQFDQQLSIDPEYRDMQVKLSGFVGDKETSWMFNTRGYTVTVAALSETSFEVTLTENVYAVDTLTESPKNMLVAKCVLNKSGQVIQSDPLSSLPYANSDIKWKKNQDEETIPTSYVTDAQTALENVTDLTYPVSFYKFIDFVETVQNITRPIFFANVATNQSVFLAVYSDNSAQYNTTSSFIFQAGTTTNRSTIGNISTNYLNNLHQMLLTENQADFPTQNIFFIKLDRAFAEAQFLLEFPINNNIMVFKEVVRSIFDVTVDHLHYGGVPLAKLNSTSNSSFSYVTNIVANRYIELTCDRVGYYENKFGGNDVTLSLVEDISGELSQPNKYTINLGKIYTGIVRIKMIDSIFPNNRMIIYNGQNGAKKNNMLYWENLSDANITYSVELANYQTCDIDTFKKEVETKVHSVYRYINNQQTNVPNIIIVNINQSSGNVEFKSYSEQKTNSEIFLEYFSFAEINDPNNQTAFNNPNNQRYKFPSGLFFTDFPALPVSPNYYRINVYHASHGLVVGQTIEINNANDVGIIPQKYINQAHRVTQIIDNDHYDIVIVVAMNLLDQTSNSMGGHDVVITYPLKFRLRFDFSDTVGETLGFRKSGSPDAVTPYQYVITNDDLYEAELVTSLQRGHVGTILQGYPYLIIKCDQLTAVNSGTMTYFYKIQLNDEEYRNKTLLYNTFVDTPVILNDPIKSLFELTLEYVTPTGDPFDFFGVNHSFTLEIITSDDTSEKTHLPY